jgi:hypothetical protein
VTAKKKKPVATVKKKSKVNEDKLRELGKKAMDDFSAEAKARHTKAKRLYDKQDSDTQEALDRMTTLLTRIAKRHMWVGLGAGDKIVFTIPEETIYHNMFYMAVEILKDLGEFDVKVAGFHFPKDLCASCHKELKPSKKKVGK